MSETPEDGHSKPHVRFNTEHDNDTHKVRPEDLNAVGEGEDEMRGDFEVTVQNDNPGVESESASASTSIVPPRSVTIQDPDEDDGITSLSAATTTRRRLRSATTIGTPDRLRMEQQEKEIHEIQREQALIDARAQQYEGDSDGEGEKERERERGGESEKVPAQKKNGSGDGDGDTSSGGRVQITVTGADGESSDVNADGPSSSTGRARHHSISGSNSNSAIRSMRASRGAAAKLMSKIGRQSANAKHLKSSMFGLMKKLNSMQRALLDYDSKAFHAGMKPESILKRILDKPPEARRITDINFLSEIVKEVKFFQNLDPTIRQALLRVVKYLKIGRKGLVFKQGAIGDKFYIIFSGVVNIYVRHDMPDETPQQEDEDEDGEAKQGDEAGSDDEPESAEAAERLAREATLSAPAGARVPKKKGKKKGKGKKKKKGKGKGKGAAQAEEEERDYDLDYYEESDDSGSEAEEKYLQYEITDLGNMVAELGNGFAFGELALINQEPRNASIVCKERTEFIIVERDDYNRILREEHRKAMKMKQEFLLGISVLSKCSKKYINAISYFFKPRELCKGQVLFRQGDDPENVYFIERGECKISIQGEITYDQFAYPVPIETRVVKVFDIAEIGVFQMFGVLSALDDVKQPYTIITTTNCTVYEVACEDFRRKFSRKVVNEFRENARMRNQRWQERFERQKELAQQGRIIPRALTHDKQIRTAVSNKQYSRPRSFAPGEAVDEDDAIALGEARDYDFYQRSEPNTEERTSHLLVMTPRKGKLLQANNTMSPRHSKVAQVALARKRRTDFDPKSMMWNTYAPDAETADRVQRALAAAATSVVSLRPADALPADDTPGGLLYSASSPQGTGTSSNKQSALGKSKSTPNISRRPHSAHPGMTMSSLDLHGLESGEFESHQTPYRPERPQSARTQGMPHESLTGVTGPQPLVQSPERVVYGGAEDVVEEYKHRASLRQALGNADGRTGPALPIRRQRPPSARVGTSADHAERLRLDLSKLQSRLEQDDGTDVISARLTATRPTSGTSRRSISSMPHRPASSRVHTPGVTTSSTARIGARSRPVSARPRMQSNSDLPGSASAGGGRYQAHRPSASARRRPASSRSVHSILKTTTPTAREMEEEDAQAGIIHDDGESSIYPAGNGRASAMSMTARSEGAGGTRKVRGAPTRKTRPISARSGVSFGGHSVQEPSTRYEMHRLGLVGNGDSIVRGDSASATGRRASSGPAPSRPPRPTSANVAFGRTLHKSELIYVPKAVQLANMTPKERADLENKAPHKKKKKPIVPVHEQQYRSRFNRYADSQAMNVGDGLSPSNYSRQESEAILQQILMAKSRASAKTGQYKSRWKI